MVNGHKSAAHTDSPDGGTGETCLGRGVQCTVSVLVVFNEFDYNGHARIRASCERPFRDVLGQSIKQSVKLRFRQHRHITYA